MPVRKAVIPAAGLGTRFLPATKALPKEMIPVVDKPGIQYVVEDAVRAGLHDVLIVTARGKGSIEDHFDHDPELESRLERVGKTEELEAVRAAGRLADVHFVRQKEPLGFGHAVLMARAHVGDEPFAVMVGDEIVPEPRPGETPLWPAMITAHERTGASVIAVRRVPREEASAYGIIEPGEEAAPGLVRVRSMVEKPSPADAPSDLAAFGQYVLTPQIFDAIERTEPGVGGEIQLTDAINLLATEGEVYAYVHDGPVFDVGKKLDYIKATIELALRRDEFAKPLKEFITELAERI